MPQLPPIQLERINNIRGLYFDNLDKGLDGMSRSIRRDAKRAIEKIKASNYRQSVAKREARKIARNSGSIARSLVAEQVEDAAFFAQRAFDVTKAWDISQRAQNLKVISDSMTKKLSGFTTKAVAVDAEAAFARIKSARLRTPQEVDKALEKYGAKSAGKQPRFRGKSKGVEAINREIQRGRLKDSKQIGLSARLHGSAAKNVRSTEKAVGRIIREGQSLDRAGKTIISEVRKGGDTLGVNQRLTKPLRELQRAGRRLRDMGVNSNDPIAKAQARQEWDRSLRNIRKVADGLVDKRGNYKEFLQIINKQGVKGMDKALGRWMDEKQRYNAERIAETESSAAYRQREVDQHVKEKRVSGAWWRLNRYGSKTRKQAGRKRARRTGGRKKKRGVQRGCVCDSLSKSGPYPMDVVKEFPRMGHPYCRCYWEWIYKSVDMARPLSQADKDWFEGLPDGPKAPVSRPVYPKWNQARAFKNIDGALAAEFDPLPGGPVRPLPGSDRAGAAFRQDINGLVSEYGIVPKSEIWGLKDARKLGIEAHEKYAGWYRKETGGVFVTRKKAEHIRTFLSGYSGPEQMQGMSTVLHETMHASMPFRVTTYEGVGAVVEEAAAEFGARGIMVDRFGAKFAQKAGYTNLFKSSAVSVSNAASAIYGEGVFTWDEIFGAMSRASHNMCSTTVARSAAIATPSAAADLYTKKIGEAIRGLAKEKGIGAKSGLIKKIREGLKDWKM